jgi:flagellar biogenesis protein FliO
MWLPLPALAALAAPAAAPPAPEVPLGLGPPGALWQTALGLALTCLLAVLVLRLLRPRPAAPASEGGALRLVARLSLGEAQAVYLLRAAGRYLLVGGTPGGLTLLSEVAPAEAERALAAEAAAAPMGLIARLQARLRGPR